jgi:hypothetical protein
MGAESGESVRYGRLARVNRVDRVGLLLARGFAKLWAEQIRVIERATSDPARRWEILKRAIDTFAKDLL